jgi:hypothetical protein
LSGAEITILQIINKAEQFEGTSVNISGNQELSSSPSSSSTIPHSSPSEINKQDYFKILKAI